MRQALLKMVAHIINTHSSWTRVISLHHYQHYLIRRDGHAHKTVCRCMTLEATHNRRHYRAGHRWQIPEPDLGRACRALRSEDMSFRRRCRYLRLTPKDIDTLIKRATYGIIDLQMAEDEDDFAPKTQ